jgi:hypothetical protein
MFDKLVKEMEFNRFGWIAGIILVVGCLGGLTVGMGALQSFNTHFNTNNAHLKFLAFCCADEMDCLYNNHNGERRLSFV